MFDSIYHMSLRVFEASSLAKHVIRGTFFYVRRKVHLMKKSKVNAYIMHIFGKFELLSIHAT